MKNALSARYGGLLVSPEDCDYSSFKNLHLLCPNCKRSVYLVAPKAIEPHVRKYKDGTTTQVQGFNVDAYFAHHPEVARSLVNDCELRVSGLSPVQKQAIQTKARQQLVKKLQAHFWAILKTNFKMFDHDSKLTVLRDLWLKAAVRDELAAKRLYQLLIEAIAEAIVRNKEKSKGELGYALDVWVEQMQDALLVGPLYPLLQSWTQTLDRKMQQMIVGEMMDFLYLPRQRPILHQLVEAGLYMFVLTQALGLTSASSPEEIARLSNLFYTPEVSESIAEAMLSVVRELFGIDKEEIAAVLTFVRDDVIQNLAFTDWAGEFEKRENLEQQKANQSHINLVTKG